MAIQALRSAHDVGARLSRDSLSCYTLGQNTLTRPDRANHGAHYMIVRSICTEEPLGRHCEDAQIHPVWSLSERNTTQVNIEEALRYPLAIERPLKDRCCHASGAHDAPISVIIPQLLLGAFIVLSIMDMYMLKVLPELCPMRTMPETCCLYLDGTMCRPPHCVCLCLS